MGFRVPRSCRCAFSSSVPENALIAAALGPPPWLPSSLGEHNPLLLGFAACQRASLLGGVAQQVGLVASWLPSFLLGSAYGKPVVR